MDRPTSCSFEPGYLARLADGDGDVAILADLAQSKAGYVILASGEVVYRADALPRLALALGIYGPSLPPASSELSPSGPSCVTHGDHLREAQRQRDERDADREWAKRYGD